MVFSVHEAGTHFEKLLDLVHDGGEVLIARKGKSVARITSAHDKPALRGRDSMKGQITLKEGWDKPLTAEEADAFWEGRW